MTMDKRFIKLAVVSITLLALTAATAVAGGRRTTVMTGTKCNNKECAAQVGVYKVKPHKIGLTENLWGALTLRWSRWARASATGSGSFSQFSTGVQSVGHVRVTLSDPIKGTFRRMKLRIGPCKQRTYIGGNGPWTSYNCLTMDRLKLVNSPVTGPEWIRA